MDLVELYIVLLCMLLLRSQDAKGVRMNHLCRLGGKRSYIDKITRRLDWEVFTPEIFF